jgi:hypothetical protein
MNQRIEHCNEEEFIMAYYDEASEPTRRHLADCAVCRGELRTWHRTLDAARSVEVPDPGPDYGAAVWERIQPRLDRGTAERRHRVRRSWGWLAAGLVLVASGYFVGSRNRTATATPPVVESTASATPPDAILRFALTQHLERSERLLREVANLRGVQLAGVDSTIPPRADRLLANNRLMRMALADGSEPAVGRTLEELERWLLDVSHLGPTTASLEDVQERLRERGLLLKIDIMKTKLDSRTPPSGLIDPARGDDNALSV